MRSSVKIQYSLLCLAFAIPATLMTIVGCATAEKTVASVSAPKNGHLIIIGGGLDEANEPIYKRLIQRAGPGAKLGVFPTASSREEAGFDVVKEIDGYSSPGTAEVIEVREKTSAAANTEPIAAQIRSKKGFFFVGGDQRRIVKAFRPDGGDSLGYTALLDVLKDGGVISGSSAGAAMMSDPIIGGGTSSNALLNGVTPREKEPKDMAEDEEPRGMLIEKGMGFFPFGLTDQHFLARGRFGRTVVGLEYTGIKRGYGIDENSAIDVNLATGVIETVGNERALLLTDMSGCKREGDARTNIRVSLLGGGDRVDGNTGKVSIVESRKPLVVQTPSNDAIPSPASIWEDRAFEKLIEALVMNSAATAVGYDKNFEVRLIKDEKTKAYIDPANDMKTLSVVNLRVDIVPKKPAAAK
ncbi:MAG TPA: cyanophycinase [Candidatus Sumerlaeota bacterium]|nr:cyanophycinase [Candidatus Sumerlaeota bacterium]